MDFLNMTFSAGKKPDTLKLDCGGCRHFYVTWDEHFPKGCRALNFKSSVLPSRVVRDSSGLDCLKFEPKSPRRD